MEIFANYILYSMIFSPLFAAAFITLIPTVDLSSKITLSRFFAFIGFFSFLCVLALFINNQLLPQYSLSFRVSDFNINFALEINKYNIFLFGAMSGSLFANMILYELNDTKSNAHQVVPFVLTFIIFITLGQRDLRVALPIISISNFIIYFLIGYGGKDRRSSTIFHMGIFLFTIDTLVLILLQYQEINGSASPFADALKAAAIIAGLSRLGLPLCAPFMRSLFLNVDEAEGPFLIIYLQIAGLAILVLIRSGLPVVPNFLLNLIAAIAILSALYLALAAVFENRPPILPYYIVTFYASLTTIVIFFTDYNSFWYLSASLFLSNLACFLHCSKSSLMLSQFKHLYTIQPRIKATWFLSLCLVAGIPGLGIGATLWPITYWFIVDNSIFFANPVHNIWVYWAILLFLSMLILSYALIANYHKDIFEKSGNNQSFIDYRSPINKLFYFSPIIIEAISLIIPIATYYVASRALL